MVKEKRGKNVESLKNLGKRRKFSSEYQPTPEAKKKGWRKVKDFREMCLAYLDAPDDETGEQNLAAIIKAQGKKAKNGDTAAATFIRDTAGQKPVDKTAQTDAEGNDIMQPPVINILPVEVKHDDNSNAETVAISVEHKPSV